MDELDLEVYAEELEKRGDGLKLATLQDIKRELRAPFAEVRRPFVEPSADEQFALLTGETSESLQEGKIVQVTRGTASRISLRHLASLVVLTEMKAVLWLRAVFLLECSSAHQSPSCSLLVVKRYTLFLGVFIKVVILYKRDTLNSTKHTSGLLVLDVYHAGWL